MSVVVRAFPVLEEREDQIHHLTGIDPDRDPLGRPTEAIFEWRSS